MTWTPERRAAQSARIRASKPWLKSTGPKTKKGKKRASKNALKHGNCTAAARKMRRILKLNQLFLALSADLARDDALWAARQTNCKESGAQTKS